VHGLTPGHVLELGLVGFGQLARKYYVPALRSLHTVRPAVVLDPLEASLTAARRAFPGIATVTDPDDVLTRPLDALIVASPPSTHLTWWNLAARHNLPIFLEKPFTLRGELAQAASGARERKLLMLDLNRRFWPPYRRLRDSVRSGLVGDLESVEIWLHVDIRPWCLVTPHRLQSTEGGILYDLGSQAIDLARWIVGSEPREVSARSESHGSDSDATQVRLGFEGGLQVLCHLAYTKAAAERVVISGRQGEIRLLNPNMTVHVARRGVNRLSSWGHARDLMVLGYRGFRRSQSMMRYSVAAALAAFSGSILRGEPLSPGFEDALANTMWLEAAAQDMEQVDSGFPEWSVDLG
jgi:predicted dehydrogenase